jgi:ketosteroid isomerase-like protein
MSQENVEVVRGMFAVFHRGDFEASLAAIDDAVSWQDVPGMPGGGLYHSADEVARSFGRWLGAWEDFRGEIQELIDAGDEAVSRST